MIDCTGPRHQTRRRAGHLDHGAKRVLVSAASKSLQDCDAVLLPGINFDDLRPGAKHHIISMASCTTNALAPVVKVLRENFGIETGFFSTVHAYTNTQSLTDQPMKDRRDSWAAAENIIPSSSGAAKALKFIWPDLNITGKAYRVPVAHRQHRRAERAPEPRRRPPTKSTTPSARPPRSAPLKGIMDVLEDEWASCRIVGDTHSSLVDLPLTQVLGGRCLPSPPGTTTRWATPPAWPRWRRPSPTTSEGSIATGGSCAMPARFFCYRQPTEGRPMKNAFSCPWMAHRSLRPFCPTQ